MLVGNECSAEVHRELGIRAESALPQSKTIVASVGDIVIHAEVHDGQNPQFVMSRQRVPSIINRLTRSARPFACGLYVLDL